MFIGAVATADSRVRREWKIVEEVIPERSNDRTETLGILFISTHMGDISA